MPSINTGGGLHEFDFYSPFFSAALITPDGVRVPLFTNTELTGATSEGTSASSLTHGLISLPFLSALTVKFDLSYLPTITAVLTPPFRDGQILIDSPLLEWAQSKIQVQFGYSSGTPKGPVLSSVYEALIQQPEISLGTECVITLPALGIAGYNASVTQASKHFPDMTRKEIIEEVARGSGSPARNLEVNFDAVPADSDAHKLLYDVIVNEDQGWRTDWMFLWQLVRESRCWMTLTGDRIDVFERNTALGAQPKYTLRYFDFVEGKLGPIQGDFPILSVSSPSIQVYLPGATKALVTQGIDSSTGDIVNNIIDGTYAAKAVGGGAVGVSPNSNHPAYDPDTGNGGAPYPRDVNFANTDDLAKAEFQASFNMGIHLEIQTLGIPDILPGDVVAVRGVGKRFDWNYGVFTVIHSLGAEGFTTTLTLMSNTSSMLTNLIESQAAVNKQEPKPAEAQGKHDAAPTLEPGLA